MYCNSKTLNYNLHCNSNRVQGMWKLRLRAFQPYHQILCMLKHVEDVEDGCVCSFPIFDIFDIHSITALRCIWSIFDIFDIHRITIKWYHIKKGMIKVCLYVLFPSSTSSTCFDIHRIWWYGWNSQSQLSKTFFGLKIH